MYYGGKKLNYKAVNLRTSK